MIFAIIICTSDVTFDTLPWNELMPMISAIEIQIVVYLIYFMSKVNGQLLLLGIFLHRLSICMKKS